MLKSSVGEKYTAAAVWRLDDAHDTLCRFLKKEGNNKLPITIKYRYDYDFAGVMLFQ